MKVASNHPTRSKSPKTSKSSSAKSAFTFLDSPLDHSLSNGVGSIDWRISYYRRSRQRIQAVRRRSHSRQSHSSSTRLHVSVSRERILSHEFVLILVHRSYMNINAFGTDNFLRYTIRSKMKKLKVDDSVHRIPQKCQFPR